MEEHIRQLTETYSQERTRTGTMSDSGLVRFFNGWNRNKAIPFENANALFKYLQDLNSAPDELYEIICNTVKMR